MRYAPYLRLLKGCEGVVVQVLRRSKVNYGGQIDAPEWLPCFFVVTLNLPVVGVLYHLYFCDPLVVAVSCYLQPPNLAPKCDLAALSSWVCASS